MVSTIMKENEARLESTGFAHLAIADKALHLPSSHPPCIHHTLYGYGTRPFPLTRVLGNDRTVAQLVRTVIVRDNLFDRQVGILRRRESTPVRVAVGGVLKEENLAVYGGESMKKRVVVSGWFWRPIDEGGAYCLGPFNSFPSSRYSVFRAVLPPETFGYQLIE